MVCSCICTNAVPKEQCRASYSVSVMSLPRGREGTPALLAAYYRIYTPTPSYCRRTTI